MTAADQTPAECAARARFDAANVASGHASCCSWDNASPEVRAKYLAQTPATDSETEVQWGWCDDTDADPEPRNVKICASREEALDAIDVPPFNRLLLRGTTKTVWEEA